DIENDLESGLERVMRMRPVTFIYNEDETNSLRHGFIADEIQKIVPSAVAGEPNAVDENGEPIYQSIYDPALTPVLTKAIQELNAKVDAIAGREGIEISPATPVEPLSEEIKALKAEVAALKASGGIDYRLISIILASLLAGGIGANLLRKRRS
ncbi:MAG: tail fiber domain-containing protein, partial [Rickettsiales bacterium]